MDELPDRSVIDLEPALGQVHAGRREVADDGQRLDAIEERQLAP